METSKQPPGVVRRPTSGIDETIGFLDRALRTVFGRPPTTGRPYPASGRRETVSEPSSARRSASLMRVNHCGEVCAQALYEGQALTAKTAVVRTAMRRASDEENDHLTWCRRRLEELESRPSRLDALYYLGSFAIGSAVGLAGDRWSLGFVAETERQVVDHLSRHLDRLPPGDARSRMIVSRMRGDEAEHAEMATESGGRPLPRPLRGMMRLSSLVMTGSTYWI